jgi:hypothetical protein
MVIAEQNNGYIWQNLLKILWRYRGGQAARGRIVTVNSLTAEAKPQFIHSATYEELIEVFGLSGPKLAERLRELLGGTQ